MRILIFGTNGKVGSAIMRILLPHHELITPRHLDCDITGPTLPGYIARNKPDLIINAAAFNGMEACQDWPSRAYAVNGAAPGVIAEVAKTLGVPFIHFSTDYVFDGITVDTSPNNATFIYGYPESFPPIPQSIYSRSKALGEVAVLQTQGSNLIFRLSTIYGNSFSGPLDPIQKFIQGERTLKIIDQYCAPTSASMVASSIAHVIQYVKDWKAYTGIYHLSTIAGIWRQEFIRHILGEWSESVTFEDAELALHRPKFSYMNTMNFEQKFNCQLPTCIEDFLLVFPNHKEFLCPPESSSGSTQKKVLVS